MICTTTYKYYSNIRLEIDSLPFICLKFKWLDVSWKALDDLVITQNCICMNYETYTLSPSPIVSTDLKLLDLVADLSSPVVCTVHNRKMETHLVLTIVYPRFAKISKLFWSLLNSLTCSFHTCGVHTLNILEGGFISSK